MISLEKKPEEKVEKIPYTNLPFVSDDEPVNGTLFWKSMLINEENLTSVFHKDLQMFIPDFVIGKHKITEREYRIYKNIHGHFFWCKHHGTLDRNSTNSSSQKQG